MSKVSRDVRVLANQIRKQAYVRLAAFARVVETHHAKTYPSEPLRIEVHPSAYGIGLFATDRIPRDATVVWYGGPFVPIDAVDTMGRPWSPSQTHSLRLVDLDAGADSAESVASVIDGEVLSALHSGQDPQSTATLRRATLVVAGALMDSSLGGDSATNVALDNDVVTWKDDQTGVVYKARRLVAKEQIEKGAPILWDYAYLEEQRPPLAFRDPRGVTAHKKPPTAVDDSVPNDPAARREYFLRALSGLKPAAAKRPRHGSTEGVHSAYGLPSLSALRI